MNVELLSKKGAKNQGIALVEPCLRLLRMQRVPKDRGLSPRDEVAATEADPRQ